MYVSPSTPTNDIGLVTINNCNFYCLNLLLYLLFIQSPCQVLFLLFCSMSGITNIGIRCCCLTLYKIRAWRTPPRGMLLAVLVLMLIILSQNVVMFSLVPDYTMFGNQHYQHTVDNKTVVTRCSAKEFPDQKVNHSSQLN